MIDLRSFFLGGFLSVAIFNLLIFIGRVKSRIHLIYTLYCLSLCNIIIANILYNRYMYSYFSYVYLNFSFQIINIVGFFVLYFVFKLHKTKIGKFILFYNFITTLFVTFFIILSFVFNNIFNYIYLAMVLSAVIFLFLVTFNIIDKKIKERHIIISVFGFSFVALIAIIYFSKLFFKIVEPSDLRYIAFLISLLFIGYVSIDTFNKEYHDLFNLKNNLESEVKNRTKELIVAKEEIEKKEQQKTNFFANIAHETRTPLTLITNYLDEFINKNNNFKEIKIIKQNIDKLKNDMINFLDIEKLERGQIFYNHDQIVNFSDILNAKILLFKKAAGKKLIKFLSDIEENVYLKIDPYALDRIINNLLDNAVKYSYEDCKIDVALKTLDNEIVFIVSDTGIGISDEQMKHIFKPYHQISYKKQNIQGIGLGLSIVEKIVNEINGNIKIESKENKGTKFTVFFKKCNVINDYKVRDDFNLLKPNDYIPMNKLKKEIYIKERKTIFIIEDNHDMLSFLQSNLYDDYNIYIAHNGLEALNKIDNIPKPDLIISDIMMDEMDGYEFYDGLSNKSKYDDIPFIFLTAKMSRLEKLNGLKKGAVDYVFKPFLFDELKSKINSLLKLIERQNKKRITNINNKISKLLQEENFLNNEGLNFNIIYNDYKINKTEKEIVALLIKGLEYKEICSRLNLSLGAVRKKIHIIYKKFKVQNKIELVNIFK